MEEFLWAVELETAFCIGMGYKQSPQVSTPNKGLIAKIRAQWLGRYLVDIEAMRLGISPSRLRAMRAASRRKPQRTRQRGMLL